MIQTTMTISAAMTPAAVTTNGPLFQSALLRVEIREQYNKTECDSKKLTNLPYNRILNRMR